MSFGRVGVIGGDGFIGRQVTRTLAEAGADPVVVTNLDPSDSPYETHRVDASDADTLAGVLAGCTGVVHLAARAGGIQAQNGDGIYTTNRAITDGVLEACERIGVESVFLASSQVVYRSSAIAVTEDAALVSSSDNPTQYAWSKVADEVIARWWSDRTGARVVFGRFGNVYGPGAEYGHDRSTVIHALIRRFSEAEPGSTVEVWGDGTAVRSFLTVEETARCVATILEHGASGEAYNVDSGQPVSIRELAETTNAVIGGALQLEFDASKPTGVPYRVGNVDKIRGLGIDPSADLEEGIRRTVVDFRSRSIS